MILILAASVWLIVLVIVTLSGAKGLSPKQKILRCAQNDNVRDVLAIGVIGAATGLFFWRLLAGQVWMPAGGGDLAQFLYPTYSFAAEWWRRGVVPLWNPYLFAGAPFVGDSQSGIFYPLNLLTFLISSPLTFREMEFLSVLHFFIAGAGMFGFLRYGGVGVEGRPLSRIASLAGAIAFEFSDLFITHFGNLNLIAVAAWMPLVLLFYRRAVIDCRAAFAVIAGALLATAFLAGHPQSFLFIIFTLVLFSLFHAWHELDASPSKEGAERGPTRIEKFFFRVNPPLRLRSGHGLSASYLFPLFMLALVAVVAIGLSAPSLLPSIEMTQHTLRAALPYEQAAQFSVPPAQLIGLFVPGFFGRGPQNAWGPWDRVEVGYIGILPLLLALLAVVLRRDSLTRFLGLLALLGLGLALGGYAILHGWLYQFVPGFGQLRAPARFIFLFDFATAALAAFAFDCLLHALPHASEVAFKRIVRGAPWVFLLIALAAGSTAYAILILGQGQDQALFLRMANAANALAFFIVLLALSVALIIARGTRFFRRRMWAFVALVVIFFDLFSLGAYVDMSTDDPSRVFDHPDAVAFLKNSGGVFRIDPRGTGVDNTWTPDAAILHGLFTVDGDNPLVLADFDRYWQSLGSRSTRLYDLLNTKYVIGRKNTPLDPKFKLAFDGDPALNVYENTRTLPRAFVVFDSRVVPDANASFAAIHASDFDPAQTVVLERPVNAPPKVASKQYSVNSTNATVKIVGYGPNEILLETNTANDGVLVLSEVYYPGWHAWITDLTPSPSPERRGEKEVDVLRADFLFRAVDLPAGAHRVRMLYDPMLFKVGGGVLVLTVLGIVGFSLWRRMQTS